MLTFGRVMFETFRQSFGAISSTLAVSRIEGIDTCLWSTCDFTDERLIVVKVNKKLLKTAIVLPITIEVGYG